MKHVYLAKVSSRYSTDYTLVFENRNDAVKTVCSCHECDAVKAASYIKALPFVSDHPVKVEITDLNHVLDIAFKAVERADVLLKERIEDGQSD